MPILRDFEHRLEGLVEGLFAKTFRGGLQPVELAKRILRDMDAAKTVGVRDVWAPNHFTFTLSKADADRFEQAEGALIQELQQVVRDQATERGWGLVGPPEVEFEVDESLGKGRFRCQASLVEGEERISPSTDTPIAPGSGADADLLIPSEGRTVRIRKEAVTIGRLPECDVVVSDPGASRRHAQIRHQNDVYVITDLGSTNGTLVNGTLVRTHELHAGDHITIGTTELEFRRG